MGMIQLLNGRVRLADFDAEVAVSEVASGADLAGAQWATSAGLPAVRFTVLGRRRPSVLGNANVFVIPLGDHPPVHILEATYGDALHLPARVALRSGSAVSSVHLLARSGFFGQGRVGIRYEN